MSFRMVPSDVVSSVVIVLAVASSSDLTPHSSCTGFLFLRATVQTHSLHEEQPPSVAETSAGGKEPAGESDSGASIAPPFFAPSSPGSLLMAAALLMLLSCSSMA